MSELFHFCCKHSAKDIGRYGIIVPIFNPGIGARLSWFTDDTTLSREALGLTMHTIKCDRMAFLYQILNVESCEPFLTWARRTGNPWVGRLIDDTKRPEHWFIAEQAVRARQVRGAQRV